MTAGKGDLDWIFKHGNEVLAQPDMGDIAAIAKCFGVENLWAGCNGEYSAYASKARETMMFASPYILSGDKEGYLNKCKEILK
jgi:hypothetical protein